MKPHIAEWKHRENIIGLGAYYECSNCGGTSLYAKSQEKFAFMSFPSRYCPYCGYQMKIKGNLEYTYGMLTTEKIGLQHLIKSMIDELPPVTPTQRWIPVSERLPEEVGTYLVTLDYKEHGKGITTLWYHGKTIGWDLCVADVVTAWQPLPKPYEEKRGDSDDSN